MAPRKDVAEEFEHLAAWLPALDGISPPYEQVYVTPSKRAERNRERDRPENERDRPIELTAIPKHLEPSIDPRCVIEEHPKELSQAVRTLRKLETLLADESTRNHGVVLIASYLSIGSEARKRFDSRGGVGLLVGLVCMPFAEQQAIQKFDSKKEAAVLIRGNELLDAARTAWRKLPRKADRPVNGRGRVRLSEVRDTIDKVVSNSMRILLGGKAVEITHMVKKEKTLKALDPRPIVEGALFYSASDVARITGRDEKTIKAMVARGLIPAERRENRYAIPASWVRSLEQPVPPANNAEASEEHSLNAPQTFEQQKAG